MTRTGSTPRDMIFSTLWKQSGLGKTLVAIEFAALRRSSISEARFVQNSKLDFKPPFVCKKNVAKDRCEKIAISHRHDRLS